MIVIIDFVASLNPNKTIAPAIGVAIPLTPITSPLNVTIQAFTTPIIAFVPYNCRGILRLNRFVLMVQQILRMLLIYFRQY